MYTSEDNSAFTGAKSLYTLTKQTLCFQTWDLSPLIKVRMNLLPSSLMFCEPILKPAVYCEDVPSCELNRVISHNGDNRKACVCVV